MKSTFKFTAILLAGLFLFSCTKDKNQSTESLLTSITWVFDRLETNSQDELVIGLLALAEALMTDATYTFRLDGTYTMSALGETDDGTWELSSDEKTVTFDKGTADEYQQTIVKLNGNELVLRSEEDPADEEPYSVTFYWLRD